MSSVNKRLGKHIEIEFYSSLHDEYKSLGLVFGQYENLYQGENKANTYGISLSLWWIGLHIGIIGRYRKY